MCIGTVNHDRTIMARSEAQIGTEGVEGVAGFRGLVRPRRAAVELMLRGTVPPLAYLTSVARYASTARGSTRRPGPVLVWDGGRR